MHRVDTNLVTIKGFKMKRKIAILPGDGIGPEVMNEALKVLDRIEKKYDVKFEYEHALVGGAAWDEYNNCLWVSTAASDNMLYQIDSNGDLIAEHFYNLLIAGGSTMGSYSGPFDQ